MEGKMENKKYPSLKSIYCPQCRGTHYKILGTKGSLGKAAGAAMFGAIGNMIQSSSAKNDYEIRPIRFKCQNCGNKFESIPFTAADNEILEMPCTIVLHRLSSFVGMAVVQQVFLNGVKVGNVSNNGELRFETWTKDNVIFVTDQSGVSFGDAYTFTAQGGEMKTLNFKRKFV